MQMIELIPNPIFIKNNDGVYVGCNKAFELITGLEKADIIGRTAHDVLTQDSADICIRYDKKLFNSGLPQDYQTILVSQNHSEYQAVLCKKIIEDPEINNGLLGFIKEIKFLRKRPLQQTLPGVGKLLTAREKEVIQLLCVGLTAPEIAARLHLSPHTICHHMKIIYSKLGVKNKVSAIGMAKQLSLIE